MEREPAPTTSVSAQGAEIVAPPEYDRLAYIIAIHESQIRKNNARIREHARQIEIIEKANDVRREALAKLHTDGSQEGRTDG